MKIKRLVKDLVEKYGTNDPFEIIEAMDAVFFFIDMHENVCGTFTREYGENIIFINSNLSDIAKREVAAHELGHLMMHTGINTYRCNKDNFFVKGKFELQANTFGAELIISDDRYYNMIKEYPGENLTDVAHSENISPEYLEIKKNRIENKFF